MAINQLAKVSFSFNPHIISTATNYKASENEEKINFICNALVSIITELTEYIYSTSLINNLLFCII